MLFCLLTTYTACPVAHMQTIAGYAPARSMAIEDKRSAKHTNKSTLVARGADTQLGSCCVLAPLATKVDLWNLISNTHYQYIVTNITSNKLKYNIKK